MFLLSASLMETSAGGSAIIIEFCHEPRDDAVKDNICENICAFAVLAFDMSGVEATGEGQTWSRRGWCGSRSWCPARICMSPNWFAQESLEQCSCRKFHGANSSANGSEPRVSRPTMEQGNCPRRLMVCVEIAKNLHAWGNACFLVCESASLILSFLLPSLSAEVTECFLPQH